MTDQNTNSGEGHAVVPSACAGLAAAITFGSDFTDSDGRKPQLMPRSAADDERICVHESGHALAARLLGVPLGGMTCMAGDGFSGRCWGPAFEARFDNADAPSLCEQIGRRMPQNGQSRSDVADIYLHAFNRVTELVAGTEAERIALDGEPWFAVDDEQKAFAYASLVTSSPASTAAFINFARVEAAELLTGSKHILRTLADELRIKRTMDGVAIDFCIEQAVAAKLIDDEKCRRRDWQQRQASAASFVAVQAP